MKSPFKNKINGVFVPVSDIEQARDWYCNLLNLPADGEIFFGHIYVLPMQGNMNIILDSKIYSPNVVYQVPSIQLGVEDIHEAYDYMKRARVEVISDIENEQWFNIKDPDGNVLMICK